MPSLKTPDEPREDEALDEGDVGSATEVDLVKLADTFSALLADEQEAVSNQESDWLRWLKLYESTPATRHKDYPWPGASNLRVGLAAIYVDTIVARIMQSVFQIKPHWLVHALNADGEAYAKPLERYLDWARQHIWNQRRVVKSAVLEMCKLGTGIINVGWQDITFRRYNAEQRTSTEVGRRFGPCPRWVPREDFLLPSGYNRVNESEDGAKAPWAACRQWFSRPALEQLASTGYLVDVEDLWGHADEESELARQRREAQNREQAGGEDETPLSGLWSLWTLYFQWDLDGDGFPEEWIMTFHPSSKTILRLQPNPYLNGMRPFIVMPFVEQEGQLDGQGIPSMIEQYEEEVSTIHNQRRDNAHLANTVMLVGRQGSGLTTREKIYPGKMWLVPEPGKDLMPLTFGQNYVLTIQEEQLTISLAERRVGISDVNLGRESSPLGRAAATTVMALLQEGSRRFDLNTSELREALSEEGLQIIEMFQTHGVPDPRDPFSPERVLGQEAGTQVRTLLETRDAIKGVLSLQLNVSTAAVNRETEKQSTLQLFQTFLSYYQQLMQAAQVASNPQLPPAVRETAILMAKASDRFIERILQAHETYDLDDVLAGEVLAGMAQQQPAMPQQMAPQGPQEPAQAPPAGPGNGAAPL